MNTHEIDCETCEQHLFEFHEGNLTAALSLKVDQHLKHCDECAALLRDIWQMNLVTTRWQDEEPAKQATAQATNWQWPQTLATAASILALIMVLTDTHFVTSDEGITMKVGRSGYVSESELQNFRLTQDAAITDRFDRLTAQQVASDQLMLRSALEVSREERREEFGTLVTYWNTTQAQQLQHTNEELQYLILSQVEDEKDIKQLTSAVQQLRLNRGNDM